MEVFFNFGTSADFSLATRLTSSIFLYVFVLGLSSLGLDFLGLLEATLLLLGARAGDLGCLATGDDVTFLTGKVVAFLRDGERERDRRLPGLADLDLDLLLAVRLTSFSVYQKKKKISIIIK